MDVTTGIVPQPPYSPEWVDFWFRNWDILDALVQCVQTAEHHLTLYHEKHSDGNPDTPCPEPRLGRTPGLGYAEIRADLMSALMTVDTDRRPVFSKRTRMVVGTIMRGGDFREAGKRINLKSSRGPWELYQDAITRVALMRGWLPLDNCEDVPAAEE